MIYIYINHTLLYIYTNPYTYTDGFKYIANNLSKSKELLQTQEALIATIKEMEATDLDRDFIIALNNFQKKYINAIVTGENVEKANYDKDLLVILDKINVLVEKSLHKQENIKKYVSIMKQKFKLVFF